MRTHTRSSRIDCLNTLAARCSATRTPRRALTNCNGHLSEYSFRKPLVLILANHTTYQQSFALLRTERPMDYREMTQLGTDPIRVRALASLIIGHGSSGLSEKAISLLTSLKSYDGAKPLSTRQLEALYSLRENGVRKSKAGRYLADHLLKIIWEARLDLLDDEAEDWLDELHRQGSGIALNRSEWRRLLALARRLDLIPQNEWVEL
jgi:hypothetical protein